MITAAQPHLTARLDSLHKHSQPAIAHTFGFHDEFDLLHTARQAILFLQTYAPFEQKIYDCKILLVQSVQYAANRVLMRSPSGVWVDVTNATKMELEMVSQGLTETPTHLLHQPSIFDSHRIFL